MGKLKCCFISTGEKCVGLKRKLKQNKSAVGSLEKGLTTVHATLKVICLWLYFVLTKKNMKREKMSEFWHLEGEAQQNTGFTGRTKRSLTQKMTFTNAPIRSKNLE